MGSPGTEKTNPFAAAVGGTPSGGGATPKGGIVRPRMPGPLKSIVEDLQVTPSRTHYATPPR